ncbi:MAG: carbohydrate ABC transporter permease [Clostridia bacterium]|nr:carbohydrate ABC transporter permease [Clostridia bacterium]
MNGVVKLSGKPKNKIKLRVDDKAMAIICYTVVGLFSLLCFLPFWYVIVYSLEPYSLYLKQPEIPWPAEISWTSYRLVLKYGLIWSGYVNTAFLVFVGTPLTMTLMIITAYPLTKKDLKGRNFILTLWVVTMYFSGGMIPNYILVCRTLGLKNNLWSLILPGLCGCYNLILMKNYMNGLPGSIEEAALIDGANDLQVLIRIVLPLCLPILATLGLFTIVGYWNSYFNSILYIYKPDKYPLQRVLREFIATDMVDEVNQGITDVSQQVNNFTAKMAIIMIATLPIMCVYPFLQKYFMTGLVLGGVKE